MGLNKGRLVAVFFAVVMATSLVAGPALASGPSATTGNDQADAFAAQTANTFGPNDSPPGRTNGGPPGQSAGGAPGHDRGNADVTIPELEENTSIEVILTATERLGKLDFENDTAATAAANDTVTEINASIQEYRRFRYADSRAAFGHLAEAQRSLAELKVAVDGDDEVVVDEISEELYAASNVSARLAVADANAVVAANEDEFRNPGQRQKAESALGNAVGALERADKAVSSGSPKKGKQKDKFAGSGTDRTIGPNERAKALTHLENAWKHSDRVLNTVEANTEPSLSLAQGQAFERNGTVLVQLEATLTDVRPYAYNEATVTVDGDSDAEPLPFVADGAAGSSASGMTLVDVGSEPENLTVTTTATATHDADRTVTATHDISVAEEDILRERSDPNEYQEVDVSNESTGVAVTVSGDGLHETDISVTNETPVTDDDYRVGPTVRIVNETPFDRAEITLPIDAGQLDRREGNLSIYTWDPSDGEPWTPVDTEIDRENGTATADVDHFSFFSVFEDEAWNETTGDVIPLEGRHVEGDLNESSDIEDYQAVDQGGDDTVTNPSSNSSVGEPAGTVYVGSLDKSLYAIDAATGAKKWEFETDDMIVSSPTVVDGTVYFGSEDNAMYAVEARTGEQQWKFEATDDIYAAPTIVNGTVFFGSRDETLYAVDAETGEQKWEYETGSYITKASTVVDGTVYVSSGSSVFAIDAATGDEIWEYDTGSFRVGSAPTVWNATVYFGDVARSGGSVYAVAAETGEKKWEFETSGWIESSPTVSNGIVYIGSGDGSLYGLSAETGEKAGEFETGDYYIDSSPTVADGTAYIGTSSSGGGSVYAVDIVSGDKEWEYKLADRIDASSSPTVANGVVYFGSGEWNGYDRSSLFAVDAKTGDELWKFSNEHNILSSPTVVPKGDASSNGSRVRHKTLGHHDGWGDEERSSVQLRDTNGDGIPNAVAEMDLGMPTGEPGVVGDPLNLDPIALDTSGDGILDNETVDIRYRVFKDGNETKLEAEVTNANHHPARVDTTGDGLTDKQQLERWDIEVVDNSDDAQEMMAVERNPDDPRSLSPFFATRTVGADPLLSDTDGEGLTDSEEFELGTDPEQIDTTSTDDVALTGDGIPDDEALADPDEDPTVYSTAAPEVFVTEFDREWIIDQECSVIDDYSIEDIQCNGHKYTVELRVRDPRFVKRVEIDQTGTTKGEKRYDDPTEVPKIEVYPEFVYFAGVDQVLGGVRGTSTTVTAEDREGNERTEIIDTQQSSTGRLARKAPYLDQKELGRSSGFYHAGAELPDFVRLVLTDPEEVATGIAALNREYAAISGDPTRSETELWIDIAQSASNDAHKRQNRDNPHPVPDGNQKADIEHCVEEFSDTDQLMSKYCQYASGWYEGYAAYLIAEAAIGTKGVTKSSSMGTLVDDVGTNLDSARGLGKIDAPGTRTGKITHRIVTDGGNPDIDAPTVQRHLRDDHGIETAGGLDHAITQLKEVRHTDELSSSEHAALAARLSRSSDSSATRAFVNNLDSPVDVRRLLDVDTATIDRLRRAYDNDVIDNDDISRITGGLEEGLIDQQAVDHALTRATKLSQDHDVTALRVGEKANTRDPYYTVWYDDEISHGDLVNGELPDDYKPNNDYPGYSPPHKSDGIVIEAQLDSKGTFVRVHGEGVQRGPWMMPADEFSDVVTSQGKSGLENRYALLDGTPKYVSKVTVPKGERVRISTVGSQDDLPGGGTQVEVRRFDRELEEDWFPPRPTSIDEYISRLN